MFIGISIYHLNDLLYLFIKNNSVKYKIDIIGSSISDGILIIIITVIKILKMINISNGSDKI